MVPNQTLLKMGWFGGVKFPLYFWETSLRIGERTIPVNRRPHGSICLSSRLMGLGLRHRWKESTLSLYAAGIFFSEKTGGWAIRGTEKGMPIRMGIFWCWTKKKGTKPKMDGEKNGIPRAPVINSWHGTGLVHRVTSRLRTLWNQCDIIVNAPHKLPTT